MINDDLHSTRITWHDIDAEPHRLQSFSELDIERQNAEQEHTMTENTQRYFTHWDWFNNVTTLYKLTKETPKMVFGIPHPDGEEERRFSKHRIRWQ